MTDSDHYRAVLEQWLQQVWLGDPDPMVTQAAAIELARYGTSSNEQLLQAIEAIDPATIEAEALEAWLESSLREESITEVSNITANQFFDLSFLQTMRWTKQVETGIQQGQTWLRDTLGALCFGFTAIQAPYAFVPATKSASTNAQLFRYELPQVEGQPWEVEVAGFTQDEDNFRLEVALLKPDEPEADLSAVPITIVLGELIVTRDSDLEGVVLFSDLPKAALDQILVRIASQV